MDFSFLNSLVLSRLFKELCIQRKRKETLKLHDCLKKNAFLHISTSKNKQVTKRFVLQVHTTKLIGNLLLEKTNFN